MDIESLLTPAEAAKLMRVDYRIIIRDMKLGILSHYKFSSHHRRITREALMKWAETKLVGKR